MVTRDFFARTDNEVELLLKETNQYKAAMTAEMSIDISI